MERENVKEKIKKLEKIKKSAEEKEKERRSRFMEDWKKKADRKNEQEIIQKGWKDLMESVENGRSCRKVN